jgi:isocitrate dehydrogenase
LKNTPPFSANSVSIPITVSATYSQKFKCSPLIKKAALEADLAAAYAARPDLAMVDSDRGITNLHVPSDVIIDASMPAAIRTSGQMWNKAGELQDTNFVIPGPLLCGGLCRDDRLL